jgi:F0F1-type ATP synthase epsilon subunit
MPAQILQTNTDLQATSPERAAVNSKGNTLYVTVRNSDTTLYEGYAIAVSSFNNVGIFSLLPWHSNFITLIKKKIIVYKTKDDKYEKDIDSAILQVQNNKVDIFLGIESI